MLQSLDPRTLALAASLGGFVLVLVLWDARRNGDAVSGSGAWCIATLLTAIGFGGNMLQDVLPDLITRLVANVLLILSMVFSWIGVRSFRGLTTPTPIALAVGVTVLMLNIIFLYVWPSARGRVVAMSLIGSVFAALAAWQYLRIRERHLLAGARTAAVPLILLSVALLARAFDVVNRPEIQGAHAATPVNVVAYLSIVFTVLSASAGTVMLINASQSERLRLVAYIDMLTGALSRRGLYRALPDWFKNNGNASAFLYVLDVDYFKQFNDNFGHEAGDKVLTTLVVAARRAMAVDSIVARMGGDEFVALSARPIDAEALRLSLNTALVSAADGLMPMQLRGLSAVQVKAPTVAIGSATLKGFDTAMVALAIREADREMYEDKIRLRDLSPDTRVRTAAHS